jgi:hypothetical protein
MLNKWVTLAKNVYGQELKIENPNNHTFNPKAVDGSGAGSGFYGGQIVNDDLIDTELMYLKEFQQNRAEKAETLASQNNLLITNFGNRLINLRK